MLPDLQRLIELQQTDREIQRLNEEIAALPKRVAAIEAKLADTKAEVEKAKATIKADETTRRQLESQIKDHQQKIPRPIAGSKDQRSVQGADARDQFCRSRHPQD